MQIKGVNNLGIYSQYEVYPSEYDEIEFCDGCKHSETCFELEYCVMEKNLDH